MGAGPDGLALFGNMRALTSPHPYTFFRRFRVVNTLKTARLAGLVIGAIAGRHALALITEKWLGRKAVEAAEAIAVDAFWWGEE